MTDFEEEYMDVLQNIEFAIVSVYRENKELTDYDVDKVINALTRKYQAENNQRSVNKPRLSERAEEVYGRVRGICDWRLGREHVVSEENEEGEKLFVQDSKTVEEIIQCLKRIRKSIKRWSKVGGRQGYLQYIDQFIA
jgi:hypothetical protein